MWRKELRKYDVNETVFNKILTDFSDYVKNVGTYLIDNYKFGYKGTDLEGKIRTIVYDGSSWLIMQEFLLNGVLNDHDINRYDYGDIVPLDNTWRQCIVRLTREQATEVEVGVNGYYAYNYMNKILKKYYTENEINKRLSMFEADYDENKKQQHYTLTEKYNLLTFDNCYKYDINSAHGSALVEIFPKATDDITKLYINRKKNPKNKAFLNYYVGYLCCVNHRKTYNWIVQRTTKILTDAINKINGFNSRLIYANTDGFIIQNPSIELLTSKTLGEFKLEYAGTVRFYRHKNWSVYELENAPIEDKYRGTLALSVRNKVNLKEGKAVSYDKVKVENGFEIRNIEEINIYAKTKNSN